MGLASYAINLQDDYTPLAGVAPIKPALDAYNPEQYIQLDKVTEQFPTHAIKEYDRLQENVVDGDTIKGSHFGLSKNVRMDGYNAPEMPDKDYKDSTYVDAAVAGTMTPEQALGWKAKQDLIESTFTAQKAAGLAEAKDRKLALLTSRHDATGKRLMGDIYSVEGDKVVGSVATDMLTKGDSNVWFEKNDKNRYDKTIAEKQIIDGALSTAQASNDPKDWARYENLIKRSALSNTEKAVYLDPKFMVAKPLANAVIGAGELTSRAGNYVMELAGNPRGIIQSAYKSGVAEIEGDPDAEGYVFDKQSISKDEIIKSDLLDAAEKFTKAPHSKEIEKAFEPIRESLNSTFNTNVFSKMTPAESASVAKALHDWEQGRTGAATVGIANAVFSGLINEENAAMMIPVFGKGILALGKAKEFKDDSASTEKALAYGAMYTALNKMGLDASLGQVKNLAKLAVGKFFTNAGVELLTENIQSLLELDAAGKIKSIKDVEKSLRDTTRETAPSAIFGGATGVARDVYKGVGTETVGKLLDAAAEKYNKQKENSEVPAVSIEDKLTATEQHVTDGKLAEAHKTLSEVADSVGAIDDLDVQQRNIDANKAYKESLNAYVKDVETTGKLDERSYGAEPEFYLDMLAAAENKEAVAKAIEADDDIKQRYGADNVANIVKTLRDIDASRNKAIDELTALDISVKNVNNTMAGVEHDVGNLGFITSKNTYPALTEYVQKSFSTGTVDPRLVSFASYQENKLDAVNSGYQDAFNEVQTFIASVAQTSSMDVKDTAMALAYLESRTVAGGKIGAKIGSIAKYKSAAKKLLGLSDIATNEEISAAYKTSGISKAIKGMTLESVSYANQYIGRNAGYFDFNAFELVGDVAQKYLDTDTKNTDVLGVSGAKKLIDQLRREVVTLNNISQTARISAHMLMEMKQTYALYQNEQGQVVTQNNKVLEVEDQETTGTATPTADEQNAENKTETVSRPTSIIDTLDLSSLTKSQREFVKQYAAGNIALTAARSEKFRKLVEKAQTGKSKKAKKLNVLKEAVNQPDVLANPDLAAKRIKTMRDISKDSNEKDKYDDAKVDELNRLHEEASKAEAELEAKRRQHFFDAVDELSTQESMENVQAVVAAVEALDEYEAFDVEAEIVKLRESDYLMRMKELAANSSNTNADVDEEFSDAVTEAAAESKIDEFGEIKSLTDVTVALQQEAAHINKMIDKVKNFVSESKNAVTKAFLIAKKESTQLKGDIKTLEKQAAKLHTKRQLAVRAREDLDRLTDKLERAKLKSEALSNKLEVQSRSNKVKAYLREAKRIVDETISKLVEDIKVKQDLVNNAADIVSAVDKELDIVNKRLYALYKRKEALSNMKNKATEQKSLAHTTMHALFEEIKVIRRAIKVLRKRYSGTSYTADRMKGREGFTKQIKTDADAAGNFSRIKLDEFVQFADTGSRISNEDANSIVKGTPLVDKLVDLIEALDKVVATTGDKVASNATVNKKIMANAAPGIILLRNYSEDMAIDENAAMALKVAMLEVVEQSALAGVDDVALEKAYGESVVSEMSAAQKLELSKLGLPSKYMASTIGKRFMKLMGLKMTDIDSTDTGLVDKNITEQYDRLVTSIGYYGIFLAKAEGYVDITDKPLAEYLSIIGMEYDSDSIKEDATMSLTKVKDAVGVEDIRKDYNAWNSVLLLEDKITDVVFNKPNINELSQSNNEITDMPAEAQENMKDMIEQEWQLKGVDDKTSAMHELLTMDKDILMRLEGYDSRVDSEQDSIVIPEKMQETIKGQNLSVKKAIEGMLELSNKILSGLQKNKFWFNFSFTKSGRSNVDSAGFNGQGTKLHRHMIFNKNQVSDVKLDVNNSEYKIMMLAIAQNMGQDTDKMSLEESVALGETLVDNIEGIEKIWADSKAAAKAGTEIDFKPKLGDMKLKINPISAFADALDAIRAISKARVNGDNSVKLTLTLEADGITNGFAIKLLQVMWELTDAENDFVSKWLLKTGIKVWDKDASGEKATKDGIAAMIGAKDIVDSYRSLAADMTDTNVKNGMEDAVNSMLELEAKTRTKLPEHEDNRLKQIREDLNIGNDANIAERLKSIYSIATKVFGELQDENGVVTSFGRALMKPLFMTFMYGAGSKKMTMELAGTLIDELLVMVSNYENLKKDGKNGPIDQLLKELFPDVASDRIKWIREYRTSNAADIDGADVDPIKVLQTAFMYTYGSAGVGILEKQFAPIVKVNKQIRESMSFVARIWEKAYKKRLIELAGDGKSPTKDMYLQALNDTESLFPIIKGPFSKSYKDGIAIFKKQLVNSIGSSFATPGMVRAGQSGAYVVNDEGIAINKVLPLLTHEFVEAATAAAVIPIHTLDGAIISRAIKGKGVMQIFDAMMLGISQAVKVVKDYNKIFYEINMEWNYLDEVLNSVVRTIETVNNMDDSELTEIMRAQWVLQGNEIEKLQESAISNRKTKEKLKRRGATMSNMLLVKDSEYLAEANNKNDIITRLNSLSNSDKTAIANEAGKSFDKLLQDVKENC